MDHYVEHCCPALDLSIQFSSTNVPAFGKFSDLQGRTATSGLIDTHAHIAEGGAGELYAVQLSDATSVPEIVARVKSKVAIAKAGEWVTGAGWDEGFP